MSDPKITPSGSGRVPDLPEKVSKKAGVSGPEKEENKTPSKVTRLVESDVLEISGPARQVARLREEIAKMPDVREERIAALKEQIKDGSYNVPTSEVAQKMIAWGKEHGAASDS